MSVKALSKYRVLHISMGLTHSAVVVGPCHVITFGQNSEGQLGIGNTKTQYVTVEVKALLDKHVTVKIKFCLFLSFSKSFSNFLKLKEIDPNLAPNGRQKLANAIFLLMH